MNLKNPASIASDSRERAIFGIGQVRKVESKAKSAWFGTGVLSDSLGRIGGTEAVSVRAEVEVLKALVANQKAVDLALSIDGSSVFPKSADWACEKLAVSVASLDTGQSDEQFLLNLSAVEVYFMRVYELNGGQNISADLAESGKTGEPQ